jgi:hypothetical protein
MKYFDEATCMYVDAPPNEVKPNKRRVLAKAVSDLEKFRRFGTELCCYARRDMRLEAGWM